MTLDPFRNHPKTMKPSSLDMNYLSLNTLNQYNWDFFEL